MSTEQQCRKLCRAHKVNPDMEAPDIWQKAPGPRQDGRVKLWHTYISQVNRKEVHTIESKEEKQRKANLQRIIDETSRDRKVTPRYSYGE